MIKKLFKRSRLIVALFVGLSSCQSTQNLNRTERITSSEWGVAMPKRALGQATLFMSLCARAPLATVEQYYIKNPSVLYEVDADGDTALNYALHSPDNQVLDFLLEKGIELKSQRPDQISALMQAIGLGKINKAKLILDEVENRNIKSILNMTNEFGWTALFYTVSQQNIELAERLVEMGADPNLKDKDNKTVLDYAGEDLWIDGIIYFTHLLKKKNYPNEIGP